MYDYLGNNLIIFKDSEKLELKKKAAVYPNIRNAFNLDFGRDYATMAVENFKNGHLFWGSIQMLDSACEIVYDLAAAYVGAVFVDASITGISMVGGTIAALNSNSTVVLGKYSSGSCGGYTKMAEKIGAKCFQLPDKLYNALEKFGLGSKINEKWLSGVVNSGSRILLNSDPAKITSTDSSPYGMEINYLRDAGYHFIETVEKGIECWEVAK